MKRLSDYQALTFDCYGTLIDWESGIWDALQPLIMHNPDRKITRQKALAAFGKHEHALEAANPGLLYPKLLAQVHAALADGFALLTTAELNAAFGHSVPYWPAFPDTADALRFLKAHYKLVILSNVHREGFASSNRKLGVEFDAIYTAEDIGSYKPNPANFEYLLINLEQKFGLHKSDILHTAQSLLHDLVPAERFGLARAWIDRQQLSASGNWGATAPVKHRPETDFLFFSMSDMANALRAELGN